MIDHKKIRETIVDALENHTGTAVVLANQTAKMPPYPYISFTVTTPMTYTGGTYGRYNDGYDRKPVQQIWSITIQSDKVEEADNVTESAFDFFDRFYAKLSEHNIVVVRLGNITNRDNFLTTGYEYRRGFDVTFGLMNSIDHSQLDESEIDYAKINNLEIERND